MDPDLAAELAARVDDITERRMAEARRRREARIAERARLAERRNAGLRARHAAKLRRSTGDRGTGPGRGDTRQA